MSFLWLLRSARSAWYSQLQPKAKGNDGPTISAAGAMLHRTRSVVNVSPGSLAQVGDRPDRGRYRGVSMAGCGSLCAEPSRVLELSLHEGVQHGRRDHSREAKQGLAGKQHDE